MYLVSAKPSKIYNMKTYKDFDILNIGAGIKHVKGAWNIDRLPETNPQEVIDIEKGLPYEDNSFKKVIADYVLEQIHDNDKFIFVMNEIHRVLKPSGRFHFKVPNAEFPEAFRDPMDNRRFTSETFTHFDKAHYRFFAFRYGFRPWTKISIKPERVTRLSIKMTPYKQP